MTDLTAIWQKYRFIIVSAGALASLVLLFFLFSPKGAVEVMAHEPEEMYGLPSVDEEESVENARETSIFVEVKGAVKYPGVFELPADARVKNVIEMAQLQPEADLLTVNQSMKVVDEMVIYIPRTGEVVDTLDTPGSVRESDSDETKININTATMEELMTLNGIGEKKAQLFINYREENGLFMKTEDIKNISGIGDKTYESLEPYITIDE
ncbi:helix-hairpin-helix domain-containing protein [Salinicoccus sesuvii]|uniref:Helix-hairpin-helix domain-containing protein n=1 Tax=Salinicoccus sesuvii TaxID=868281 RepID=A0ABV7N667_9STAP